ncbi:MAG: CBS domain-containing protein [Myxococcales bacterium]|nr:CBS domain-containing protein [Myxococcales bacterium]
MARAALAEHARVGALRSRNVLRLATLRLRNVSVAAPRGPPRCCRCVRPGTDLPFASGLRGTSPLRSEAQMLKVSDIMTRDVFTLPAGVSASEAAWGLAIHHVSGAPVRSSDGRFVGLLSKSDLVDPEKSDWREADRSVEEVMTPSLLGLPADAPAMAAVRLMVTRRIHRVVALDRHGRMVGIVTPMDVLNALLSGSDFAGRTAPRHAPANGHGHRHRHGSS